MDTSPTHQAEKAQEQHRLFASLIWTPQNPPHLPIRSNMHHSLQQSYEEPTIVCGVTPVPGSTCPSTHVKIKPTCHCLLTRSKVIQMRHRTLFPNYLSDYYTSLVVCRPMPPSHRNRRIGLSSFCSPGLSMPVVFTLSLLFSFSRWDVVCLYFHWVVQNYKQHPFLIHADSIYPICILFLRLERMGLCTIQKRAPLC